MHFYPHQTDQLLLHLAAHTPEPPQPWLWPVAGWDTLPPLEGLNPEVIRRRVQNFRRSLLKKGLIHALPLAPGLSARHQQYIWSN